MDVKKATYFMIDQFSDGNKPNVGSWVSYEKYE